VNLPAFISRTVVHVNEVQPPTLALHTKATSTKLV